MTQYTAVTFNTDGFVVNSKMKPRHLIDDEYNNDRRHIKQWKMTIDWLKQFDKSRMPFECSQIMGKCLDCGDRTPITDMIETEFMVKVKNTTHDLNDFYGGSGMYKNIFAFEVI